MEQNLIALGYSEAQFERLIYEQVQKALSAMYASLNEEKEDDLLTRAGAVKYLKISKVTLWKWTKEGKLKSSGIGNRVYYRKSDLDDAMQNIN